MTKIFKTWNVFEKVTAALMNQELRDNFGSIWKFQQTGDILYGGANGDSVNRLPIGTEQQTLAVQGGIPVWMNPVWTMVRKSTPQTITNNTETEITSFDYEVYTDEFSMHSGTDNFITLPVAGVYMVGCYARWDNTSASSTLRQIMLKLEGMTYARTTVMSVPSDYTYMNLNMPVRGEAGNKIYMSVLQKSGGNMIITEPNLWVMKVR